ncbi:hypothetical protein DFJ74DRAFT_655413 [Hyaloraphidium curvatum]|nr:hypothetical protein DFJ74DRAFT_655413 [Hyaloraphidium curvatum]
MELPTLGVHCAAEGCHQLDFLPFLCPHCPPEELDAGDGHATTGTTVVRAGRRHKVYCGDHRTEHAGCTGRRNYVVPTVPCPLCATVLPVRLAATGTLGSEAEPPSESDIKATVEKHIVAGCKSKPTQCLAPRCKEKPNPAMTCKLCTKTLCTKHRFPEMHSCAAAAKATLVPSQAAALARKGIAVR